MQIFSETLLYRSHQCLPLQFYCYIPQEVRANTKYLSLTTVTYFSDKDLLLKLRLRLSIDIFLQYFQYSQEYTDDIPDHILTINILMSEFSSLYI